MIRFRLHGVEIHVTDDESEATIHEVVVGSGRKVAGKLLHTVKASKDIAAVAGAIGWAKKRRIENAADEEREEKAPKKKGKG